MSLGGDAFTGVRLPIFGFIFSSSTYFSKQSCFEIWEMLKPSLKNVNSPECYVALGWLSLFLPSQVMYKRGVRLGTCFAGVGQGHELGWIDERMVGSLRTREFQRILAIALVRHLCPFGEKRQERWHPVPYSCYAVLNFFFRFDSLERSCTAFVYGFFEQFPVTDWNGDGRSQILQRGDTLSCGFVVSDEEPTDRKICIEMHHLSFAKRFDRKHDLAVRDENH